MNDELDDAKSESQDEETEEAKESDNNMQKNHQISRSKTWTREVISLLNINELFFNQITVFKYIVLSYIHTIIFRKWNFHVLNYIRC